MAYTLPVVAYSTTLNGTYTALTGIQSVSISRGRKRFQDPFPPTTCVIELIPANSYTTPLAIGQWIDVRTSNAGSSRAFFTGRITDVERNYSFPYNSGTGAAPADRIVITAAGAIGALGQSGFCELTGSGDAFGEARDLIETKSIYSQNLATGVSASIKNAGINAQVTSGANNPNMEEVNGCLRAGQGFMDDVDSQRTQPSVSASQLYEAIVFKASNRAWTFSDSTTGAGIYKYNGLSYLSGAQSTFNQIQVTGWSSTLAAQTVQTGSAPYNTLDYQTLLTTTSDMLHLANYLLTTQAQTTPTPFVVRTNTVIADGIETQIYMPRNVGLSDANYQDQILGATTTVIFRGTTVNAQVQGVTANFYPDQANFEFYLSPYLGVAFTLDSTINGVLDTNRLGYP